MRSIHTHKYIHMYVAIYFLKTKAYPKDMNGHGNPAVSKCGGEYEYHEHNAISLV